jgi:hypothetical protein
VVTKDLNVLGGPGYEYETLNEYCKYFGRIIDIFPGYDKVNVSWSELSRVPSKKGLKTELQDQKGVYLILDTFKSTTGDQLIIDRENWWKTVLLKRRVEQGYNRN